MLLPAVVHAERIPITHLSVSKHEFMVVRSDGGKELARAEFTQTVQGDEVTISLNHRFADGSIDDETTTFSQHGKFQFIRDHHIQQGPYFGRSVDFTVDAASGLATSGTLDKNGKMQFESRHIDLPDDLANGFVATLLLNVPPNTAPFRVGFLAPFAGGRLLHLLITPEGEQPFQRAGQTLKATVFRIHPELGGILGALAGLLGLQPKDLRVWILEGEMPAVIRVVGQLGGQGQVLSSELEGTSYGK
jgi:hypothetical protein